MTTTEAAAAAVAAVAAAAVTRDGAGEGEGKEAAAGAAGAAGASEPGWQRRLARRETERWEFPPRSRVGSFTCKEPGCRNEFVMDGRERRRMLEGGFKMSKWCPACRRTISVRKHRPVRPEPLGEKQKQRQKHEGGGGGGGGGGGRSGGFASNPGEKERSTTPRWKSKKAKAKPQRSHPKAEAGMFRTTLAMMAARR